MFRHDQPARRPPPPFGPMMPRQRPPFTTSGPCSVPSSGHLPPRPDRPFLASDSHYQHNRPPRGHYMSPHCSNFSIDRSTVIALGGSQQIVPPAETSHLQVPPWNPPSVERHQPDSSDQAGEEFLRCIAANKPLPNYLKGNIAYNLADALKSANDLKEAVKSDPQFHKHAARSKSRSRSRSRGRSRARSRARSKSRGRSKSRARSRSRGRSKSRGRCRSRGRSKSRVCGKSRAKSKTRARSESQSRSKKSRKRSKSRARRSRSRSSSSTEKNYGREKKRKRSPGLSSNSSVGSGNNLRGTSLLEGLKLVIQSKDLEDRLPSLKDALLSIQASKEIKKVENVPEEPTSYQRESPTVSDSLENDSMLLPHERVGSDFSWLQERSQEEISIQKAREFEDEESFLYGTETSCQLGERAKQLVDPKQLCQVALSTLAPASLDKTECEKIKNILNSLGGTPAIGNKMVQTQGQREGSEVLSEGFFSSNTAMATLNNPNVRKALESLQSLIKVTKEKRMKEDGHSETSCDKQKAGDGEDKKREKQAKIRQMESLAKELEELLKQDGMGFMSPVIGFYCQKCEEFIGDFNSAEKHAELHRRSTSKSQKEMLDKHSKDSKGHWLHSSTSSQHSSERRDHGGYSHQKDSGGYRDLEQSRRDEKDPKEQNSLKDSRAGPQSISLKDEMKKERMLITVNRRLTPPPQANRTKEENQGLPVTGRGKAQTEDADSRDKSSRNGRHKHRSDKTDSSDSSTDDRSSDLKHPKKKKKKKDKKKKKEKNKS